MSDIIKEKLLEELKNVLIEQRVTKLFNRACWMILIILTSMISLNTAKIIGILVAATLFALFSYLHFKWVLMRERYLIEMLVRFQDSEDDHIRSKYFAEREWPVHFQTLFPLYRLENIIWYFFLVIILLYRILVLG